MEGDRRRGTRCGYSDASRHRAHPQCIPRRRSIRFARPRLCRCRACSIPALVGLVGGRRGLAAVPHRALRLLGRREDRSGGGGWSGGCDLRAHENRGSLHVRLEANGTREATLSGRAGVQGADGARCRVGCARDRLLQVLDPDGAVHGHAAPAGGCRAGSLPRGPSRREGGARGGASRTHARYRTESAGAGGCRAARTAVNSLTTSLILSERLIPCC
mmetsp:Transcript_60758/g.120288  ORF Transcript_60758/g.120288 Transcript_60758/m.120288 type:complete len:217 (+) Transcript_60758:457-1107(+)